MIAYREFKKKSDMMQKIPDSSRVGEFLFNQKEY